MATRKRDWRPNRPATTGCVVSGSTLAQGPSVIRLSLLLMLISTPVLAETWSGHPRIVDGDTIVLDQGRVRLLNMDGFETAQNCRSDGGEYPCGTEATRALITLVTGRDVRCEGDKLDRYRPPSRALLRR